MILTIDALLMRYPAHRHLGALYFPHCRDEELDIIEINLLSKGYQGSLCQSQELVLCFPIPKLQI